MPITPVTLNDLNPLVLEKLIILATKHNRSLSDEIKAILEQVTSSKEIEQKHNSPQAWSKIDEARKLHAGQSFSDSAELLREDRQR
ncbi:hypothetical protein [Gloeocapsa sp. PCC 73106]|uniref:hypothetical protein n=1 Tax=Gloeocapsa sp. PCC 73106 TaxID=102232 RepID=UPI0002AC00CF|nr:hypothetical protein [Gloeocapsa sp. PCC 73106]ELS00277.1 hypothetical protein GLO73106DRAFT_00041340 [Gloeocapsa sp. PCC 73106]